MRAYLHLWIIAGIALALSALTLPMSFLAELIDVSYDYNPLISAVIRSIWNWGPDLTSGTKLNEPLAEILLHSINFCIFYLVLFLAYRGYLLVRKLV